MSNLKSLDLHPDTSSQLHREDEIISLLLEVKEQIRSLPSLLRTESSRPQLGKMYSVELVAM